MYHADMTRLLDELEVAEILGLTTRQVSRLAKRGEIPSVVMPGKDQYRFDVTDLLTWIASRKRHVWQEAAGP